MLITPVKCRYNDRKRAFFRLRVDVEGSEREWGGRKLQYNLSYKGEAILSSRNQSFQDVMHQIVGSIEYCSIHEAQSGRRDGVQCRLSGWSFV